MATSNSIRIEQAEHILILRIDRAEKKNALTSEMYEALAMALTGAADDANVRVVVISGGESCFTAGNDIGDFVANPPLDEKSPVLHFLQALTTFPKPLVAAVNGVAVGIGTTMLLHCDLVYAGEDACFHLPFVDLGLVPEGASSLLLPQLVGRRKASELLLLAEPFDSKSALALGLINRVLPAAEVEPFALAQAQKLAAKDPAALQLTKALILHPQQEAIAAALVVEAHHFANQLRSPEAQAALQTFIDRRKLR